MSDSSPTPAEIAAGVEVMLSGVRGIPQHLMMGADLVRPIAAQLKPVERVTLCALGGSAFPGELLKVITDPLDIPFDVSRSYRVERGALDRNAQLHGLPMKAQAV